MKCLWIAGLPEEIRQEFDLTKARGAAWSWVMGCLPPPAGVELHVLCPVFGLKEEERHFAYAGATWHCFRLSRWEPLFLRRRFARKVRPFVRVLDPDVVHGWGGESGCGLVATYLSDWAVVSVQGLLRMLKLGIKGTRVKVGRDERGGSYWLRCLMEVMTYRHASRLICESETAQTWLKRCYGQKATVVPYPLRKEFLQSSLPLPVTPCSLRHGNRPRVLFVGQNVPRKGYQDAVQACKDIAELVKAEGLSVGELVSLMQQADAFIVPSYGDTGPTALKEALSQGIYPIVYDNTGAAELVRRYGYGELVPTGDVAALRKAVMGIKIREKGLEVAICVRRDLSCEQAWEALLDVYSRLGFSTPPEDQLKGAVGRRIGHFAKMLRMCTKPGHIVISFQTGVRQNLGAMIRAKLSGRRVVREINEWPLSVTWDEGRIKQWIEIHLLPKLFDGFICISDLLVDFCREHGRKNVPILKVPMTVDVAAIDFVPTFQQSNNPSVVYAGSVTEFKDGVETLKKAMEGIKADLLMISGRSHEEAVAIMKGANCLVLARPDSQQARAGFPTKLGEYLATGIPVVVTKTGEISRYLKDGVNAYLAEPGDIDGIASKIKFVLEHPEEAAGVGVAGRKVAALCFDWHNHAESVNRWLKQFT